LIDIAKELKIKVNDKNSKDNICSKIKKKLIFLEKFSLDNEKKTFIIIPSNHEEYEFPLNLQDRVDYIQDKLRKKLENISINIKKEDNGIFMNSRSRDYFKFKITINAVNLENYDEYLVSKKFNKIDSDNYERVVE
jgi:hypothetical protein